MGYLLGPFGGGVDMSKSRNVKRTLTDSDLPTDFIVEDRGRDTGWELLEIDRVPVLKYHSHGYYRTQAEAVQAALEIYLP